MSEVAARCPHCGARQSLTAGPAPTMSRDEARALLTMDAINRPAGPPETGIGSFGALFLPHPRTRGLARLAEVVLMVLGLPLIAGSMISMAISRRATRTRRHAMSEGGKLGTAIISGGSIAWLLLDLARVTTRTELVVLAIGAGALVVRHLIRRRATDDPGDRLARLER
jgi:hypothetical protein